MFHVGKDHCNFEPVIKIKPEFKKIKKQPKIENTDRYIGGTQINIPQDIIYKGKKNRIYRSPPTHLKNS